MCVLGINVVSFHNCSISVCYCSESVVFVVLSIGICYCSDSVVFVVLSIGVCYCSDSVVFVVFYWSLLLFPQCGVCCFSIGVCYCSHSVVLVVFLLEFATVPTVLCLLFFYWSFLLFPQCGVCCFSFYHMAFIINVREYRRNNHKRTIQRNWQQRVHKKKKNKSKTQHNILLL